MKDSVHLDKPARPASMSIHGFPKGLGPWLGLWNVGFGIWGWNPAPPIQPPVALTLGKGYVRIAGIRHGFI